MSAKNFLLRTFAALKRFLLLWSNSPLRYAITAVVLWVASFLVIKNTRRGYGSFPEFLLGVLSLGLVVVIMRAFRNYQQQMEKAVTAESEHTRCKSPAIGCLLMSLRRRALSLRLASWFILGLTFTSIMAGLYIFSSAGEIARSDTNLYRMEEIVRDRANNLGQKIDDVREVFAGRGEEVDALYAVKELRENIDKDSKEFKETLERLEKTYASERFWVFLSATSTRIGSILMLIFLVQILLSVYRYSVRMASYYEARADALLLYEGKEAEQLELFVSMLSAEKVEFGKTPQSPTEQAIELIKGVAAFRK